MLKLLFPKRFALIKTYILFFLALSLLVRVTFTVWSFSEVDTSFFKIISTFVIGFLFDLGTVSFFALPYIIYLLIIPKKLYGSILDKVITYFAYSVGLIIFLFSFFAEITFWEEFQRRFNFIAVDYLIYTYEVVKNINESYPLPLLISSIILLLIVLLFFTKKYSVFKNTFNNETSFKEKLPLSGIIIATALIFGILVKNKNAEQFDNRYNDEIAKTGIYSFFAAFRNNELPYTEFYKTMNKGKAFSNVKQHLNFGNNITQDSSIFRQVHNSDLLKTPQQPNVIFICIESMSGKFLNTLGSKQNITPTLDSLA